MSDGSGIGTGLNLPAPACNPQGAAILRSVDVRRQGDTRTLEIELDLGATPERVWRALTEAEELMSWFPLQAEVEPGEGGVIRIGWDGSFASDLKVQVWEPGERLRTTWPLGKEEGGPVEGLVLDFSIAAGSGGGTRLRLVHSGFPTAESWDGIFDSHRRGWSYELRSLRHYLTHHPGISRRVVRVCREAGALSAQEVWDLLFSADGLLRSGSLPLAAGERYAITLPSGHRLAGRVMIAIPPTDLGAAVDAVEGTENSLFRVSVDRWSETPGPLEVRLWLATWGMPADDVAAIQRSWELMLDGILAGASAA